MAALGDMTEGVELLRRSCFFAANAARGTGIASKTAGQAYSATQALMTVYNSASVDDGDVEWITPVMLRLTNTVTNTAATDFNIEIYRDPKNRWTSGGTALTGEMMSCDTDAGWAEKTSVATIYFGDIVAAAAGTYNAKMAAFKARTSIYTAGESLTIWFGAGPGSVNVKDAEADVIVLPLPIRIGRGSSMTIHGYGASQTGGSPAWDVEFYYIEHPAS